MNKSILLAGVGGQGTVLASKLIAQAAIDLGFPARTAETIGMAQRGGCVVSHVRIGEAHSPLIPKGKADIIIGFEPAEAVRCLPYLKEEGVVVTTKKANQAGDRVSVRLLLRRHGNDRLLNPKPGKACGGGRRKNLRRLRLPGAKLLYQSLPGAHRHHPGEIPGGEVKSLGACHTFLGRGL